MKRIMYLLTAMTIVGSMAQATETDDHYKTKSAFKFTDFGQYIENDNDSGGNDKGDTYFMQTVSFESENWKYHVEAGKIWGIDGSSVESDWSRLELNAWRNVLTTDNGYLDLGVRTRFETDQDRYYPLRAQYGYKDFSGWIDGQYYSVNTTDVSSSTNGEDYIEIEAEPLKYNYGKFGISYYVDYLKGVGSHTNKEFESLEQQIRMYAPIYDGKKLDLSLEYRFGLNKTGDKDWEGEGSPRPDDYNRNKNYGFGDYNAPIINWTYDYSERLDFYGYYRYDIIHSDNYSDTYYGEFLAGWQYKL